jgi:hypothetical protein
MTVKLRDSLTTTIQRESLAQIVAGTKRTEYREDKPFWRERLAMVSLPFRLRLINGMSRDAPEVTVLIDRIRRNRRTRNFELHIAEVLKVKNWDRRRQAPLASRTHTPGG